MSRALPSTCGRWMLVAVLIALRAAWPSVRDAAGPAGGRAASGAVDQAAADKAQALRDH